MRNLARILQNFGDMITHLSIAFNAGVIYSANPNKANTNLFKSMIKYCVGPLQSLRLKYCRYLDWDQIVGEESLFGDLNELELFECDADCDQFSAYAYQVNKLSIVHGPFERQLHLHYPNLKSFTLKLVSGTQNSGHRLLLEHFLQQHTDLDEIILFGLVTMDYSIIANMHQLTSLAVDEFYGEIEECSLLPLAQLDRLTSLSLSTNSQTAPLLTSLASTESLRELSLTFGVWSADDAVMEGIAQFKNLRKLHLDRRWEINDRHLTFLHGLNELRELILQEPHDITTAGLMGLVNHLPALRKIRWSYGNYLMKISETTYCDIGEIYRRRNQQLTILFYVDCSSKTKLQYEQIGFCQFVKYYHDSNRLNRVPVL